MLRYRARGDRPLAGFNETMRNDDGTNTVYMQTYAMIVDPHHWSPRQLLEVELVKVRSVGSVVPTENIHGVFVNDGSMRVTGGGRGVELLRYGAPFVLDP